ncbi:MAG: hypothetical protein HQ594_00005 [Candidatus Omnitrophica bacterium]|nr:hypothetical protein [Candidatus Omnitrophota bacterium]
MKLYKFRSLRGCESDMDDENSDFSRSKKILETGKFWCSKFSELNDPMEGVFYAQRDSIPGVYNEKNKYKICSFSARVENKRGFENPCMWGYYANGFKGIAIEVEVCEDKVEKMKYGEKVPGINDSKPIIEEIKKILKFKTRPWRHEAEFRFLSYEGKEEEEIGEITKVHFGNPYGNISNKAGIYKDNRWLKDYDVIKEHLIKVAKEKRIDCYAVNVEGSKVLAGQKL